MPRPSSPRRCRLPAWEEPKTLAQTARMLAHAVSPVILFGKGVTAQRDEKLVQALIKLATLIGAVDSERVGLLSLKGEANSVAAALFGLDKQFSLDGQQVIYVALGDDFASKSLVQSLEKAHTWSFRHPTSQS